MPKKLLSLGVMLLALTAHRPAVAAPLNLLRFQASGLAVMPTGASSPEISGHLAWIPSIDILGIIGVRGEVGVTNITGGGATRFFATNYELLLTLGIFPTLTLEAGGGLTTWLNGSTSEPTVSGCLSFSLPVFVKRIFVGYSRMLTSSTSVFKAGVGFDL